MTRFARLTRRSLYPLIVTALAFAAVGRPATAAPAKVDGNALVKVTAMADASAIVPGKPFRIAVKLAVSPGWHVYWQNPGDAGLPTQVALRLPPGFTGGTFGFPTPVRFDQPGDVVGYGYEGEVTLVAEVTPPATLPVGRPVRIDADADWLVCRDVCRPGRAAAWLDLPVAAKAEAANADQFAAAAARVPAASDGHPLVKAVKVDQDGDRVTVRVTWAEAVAGVELFPAADDAREVKVMPALVRDATTEVDLIARTLAGAKPKSDTLPAVIAYRDPKTGERRGVAIKIKLNG